MQGFLKVLYPKSAQAPKGHLEGQASVSISDKRSQELRRLKEVVKNSVRAREEELRKCFCSCFSFCWCLVGLGWCLVLVFFLFPCWAAWTFDLVCWFSQWLCQNCLFKAKQISGRPNCWTLLVFILHENPDLLEIHRNPKEKTIETQGTLTGEVACGFFVPVRGWGQALWNLAPQYTSSTWGELGAVYRKFSGWMCSCLMVFGWFLDGFWWFLDGFWWFLEGFWMVFGWFLDGFWMVFGWFLMVFGWFLMVFGWFLDGFWICFGVAS